MTCRKINGYWYADFRFEGQRYRKKSPLNTKQGAMNYGMELLKRLTKGEPLVSSPPKPKMTLKAFSQLWFETYVNSNNRPSEKTTKLSYMNNHLLPSFGNLSLEDISNEKIERYKALKQTERYAPKTINNHLSTLQRCLRSAYEWGYLKNMPVAKFLKVPPQRFDFLTPQEGNQLLEAIDNEVWFTMILCALRTGMRIGELLALQWDDVDLERRLIVVRRSIVQNIVQAPKNNKFRSIPLSNDLCKALQKLKQVVHSIDLGIVFAIEPHKPIHRQRAVKALRRYYKRAKLRHTYWHMLRHSFASQMAMAGVPMRVIQELMGHSSLDMTIRYSHLTSSVLHSAVKILEHLPNQKLTFGHYMGNGASSEHEYSRNIS